ncbi:MAG: recombinase family protein [Rikenellaceae bacterium]
MKTKYVSYLRQSTRKQEISGLGLEAQREIIEKTISHKNQIIREFIETESGRKSNRPKLTEALELCKKEGATLIVAKLDRLSRNVAFTSKLLESDVEIKFGDFPDANRLVLHIISSIAEYEASLISQRTRQALNAKKERGFKLGKPNNLLDNHQAALTKSSQTNRTKAADNPNNRRAIAMLRILAPQNLTLSEMARQLNSEGFVTSTGRKFHPMQVKILLERDVVM